jgi:hypothetical protein
MLSRHRLINPKLAMFSAGRHPAPTVPVVDLNVKTFDGDRLIEVLEA